MNREENFNTPNDATRHDNTWERNRQEPDATRHDRTWEQNRQEPDATRHDSTWEQNRQEPDATRHDSTWEQNRQQPDATRHDSAWEQNRKNSDGFNPFHNIDEFKQAAQSISTLNSLSQNTYPVQKILSDTGGESVVLLCSSPSGKDVVAKVYYEDSQSGSRGTDTRQLVYDYMKTPDGQKYTLAVEDYGWADLQGGRFYFEIMPYCPEGDLSTAGPFDFDELVKLISYLNEGLHSFHSAHLLHRDIKPQNLYRIDGMVRIGDFGVVKPANAGATSKNPGTPGYQAPETLIAATKEAVYFFDERCDYYALGVTVASLFEGHFIYKDMEWSAITLAIQKGLLPLMRRDPHRDELNNLLKGLCRYDPKYRFGYEDVKKWIENHHYTGYIAEDTWPRPYRLLDVNYSDDKSLFYGIVQDAAHWEEAKALLYKKYFEQFFVSFRPDLARAAQLADEAYRTTEPDMGLAVFLNALFPAGPIVWKGQSFNSIRALAEKMLVTAKPEAYGHILQCHYISYWLEHTKAISPAQVTVDSVREMENYSAQNPALACYWFGNAFAEHRLLKLEGLHLESLDDVIRKIFGQPAVFYQIGMDKFLMPREGAEFYGFLFSYGCRKFVDEMWQNAADCDRFQRTNLFLGMMDSIACDSKLDPAPIRKFLVSFGPLGIAVKVKELVEKNNPEVYRPLDSDGQKILDKIRNFSVPDMADVNTLVHSYQSLVESVAHLQEVLIDNPFILMSGNYHHKGILCQNLKGCFLFRIFDRKAPLAFQAMVEPK